MSLNLSGLSTYVKQNSDLQYAAIAGFRTADYITIVPMTGNSQALNQLNFGTLGSSLQVGGCGWDAQGTTYLTQRTISIDPIKYNEAICPETLRSYWASEQMSASRKGGDQTVPAEAVIVEAKVKEIAKSNDVLAWQGNKLTGTGSYLALANGFVAALGTGSGAVLPNSTLGITGSVTVSNVISIVDSVVNNIPEDIADRDDLVIFTSYANFRLYVQALKNANLYHYSADNDTYSMLIGGSNVKLVAVPGLAGTSNFVGSFAGNFVMGLGDITDYQALDMWYSQDNREVRMAVDYSIGFQIAFPTMVSWFKI